MATSPFYPKSDRSPEEGKGLAKRLAHLQTNATVVSQSVPAATGIVTQSVRAVFPEFTCV